MNAAMIAPSPTNSKRFVAPVSDYEAGRALYKRGKRLADCASDEAARGWLDAERKGADDYYASMARDGAAKFVNWNSGADSAGVW